MSNDAVDRVGAWVLQQQKSCPTWFRQQYEREAALVVDEHIRRDGPFPEGTSNYELSEAWRRCQAEALIRLYRRSHP